MPVLLWFSNRDQSKRHAGQTYLIFIDDSARRAFDCVRFPDAFERPCPRPYSPMTGQNALAHPLWIAGDTARHMIIVAGSSPCGRNSPAADAAILGKFSDHGSPPFGVARRQR
jgi:hypothetical protein